MGFVVLQVNYRGSAGFGTRFREGLREKIDEIPVADIRAAIAWVEARQNVDRKRVALLGQGFGGYLALRAMQLYPDDFRCAVAINAPTDLELWSQKPESWREALDRGEVASNTQRQTQNFMINFGPGQSGPLAQRGLLAPSFAEQGMGALDAAPSTNGDPDPVGGTTADAAPAATAGGRGGPPPPEFPPDYVNFASELRRWYFGHDKARLAALSPARHAELLTKPVLLVQDPYDAGGEAGVSATLRSALGKAGNPPEYLEITSEFTRGLPKARLQTWTKVQEFVMVSLYDFDVKIGETKVQK
jgi:pimeloyl-ACP methyl ester carboxylesterase